MKSRALDLGNGSIKDLLIKLAVPSIVALLVNGLYNLVDTVFVGKGVGTLGIGALTVVFPIQVIIQALGLLVGIGGGSLAARSFGADDDEKANDTVGNGFSMLFIIMTVVILLSFMFMEPMLRFFGASDNILPYAKDYAVIILAGSIFFAFSVGVPEIIRATGDGKTSMMVLLIGAAVNIILDPIFILGLNMGVKGAAYATVIAQIIAAIYAVVYMLSSRSCFNLKFNNLKIKKDIFKGIFAVGFSGFVVNASASFVSIVSNKALIAVGGGDEAIAIVGIITRILLFLYMPILGVVAGMQPIVAFNYGAEKFKRVKETVKLSINYTTIIGIVLGVITLIFATSIISVFTNDTDLIKNAIVAARISFCLFLFVGIQNVGAYYYQSTGEAVHAFVFSLMRQVITFVPLVIVLPKLFNLGALGVWVSFPLADLLSGLIIGLYVRRSMKKLDEKVIKIDKNHKNVVVGV